MASKKARAWLASQGIKLSHDAEAANFSVGSGHGPNAMPYQVIRMDSRYGSSCQTVGWAATLADARRQRDNMNDATRDASESGRGGGEYIRGRTVNHYIRDIRTDTTVS